MTISEPNPDSAQRRRRRIRRARQHAAVLAGWGVLFVTTGIYAVQVRDSLGALLVCWAGSLVATWQASTFLTLANITQDLSASGRSPLNQPLPRQQDEATPHDGTD